MKNYFYIILMAILFNSCKKSANERLLLFDKVDGLKEGAAVRCRGMQIGHVTSMELYNNKVLVKLKFDKSYDIPVGSKFIIYPSLMDEETIDLEPPESANIYIDHTDTLTGIYAVMPKQEEMIKDSITRVKSGEIIGAIIKGIASPKIDSTKSTGSIKHH